MPRRNNRDKLDENWYARKKKRVKEYDRDKFKPKKGFKNINDDPNWKNHK